MKSFLSNAWRHFGARLNRLKGSEMVAIWIVSLAMVGGSPMVGVLSVAIHWLYAGLVEHRDCDGDDSDDDDGEDGPAPTDGPPNRNVEMTLTE